jgi:ankyrin repeat protein
MTFLLDNPLLALGIIVLILGVIYYIKAGNQQEKERIRKILAKSLDTCKTPKELEKLIIDKKKYNKGASLDEDLSLAIVSFCENSKFNKYLKVLLKSGANINYQPNAGQSIPLFHTILNGLDAASKILLDNDAYIKLPNSNGVYLVGVASASGNTQAIDYAIKNGCTLSDADKEGNSAIDYALENGQIETANFLIKKNIDLDNLNNSKLTTLHKAIFNNDVAIVSFLLNAGANPNIMDNDGDSTVQMAVNAKSLDILRQLLNADADLNTPNKAGDSAIQMAILSEQYKMVEKLLSFNAKVFPNDAYFVMQVNNYNITKLIFKSVSFDLNLSHYLHEATASNQVHAIKALLELDADPDFVKKDLMTPTILASTMGSMDAFTILLKYSTMSPFTKLINRLSLSDGKVNLSIKELRLSEVGGEIKYTTNATPGSMHWEIATREVERSLGLSDVKLKENKDNTYSVFFYNGTNLGTLARNLVVRGSEVSFVSIVDTDTAKNIVFKNIPGSKLQDWSEQQGYIEDILGLPVVIEQYNNDHVLFPDLGRDKLIIIKESNMSAIPSTLGLTGEFVKETKSKGVKEVHFMNVSDSAAWVVKTETISQLLNRKIQVVIDGTKIILRDSIEAAIPQLLDWEDTKDTPVLLHTVESNGNADYFYSYSHNRDLNKWRDASRKVSFKTLFNQPDKVYKLAMYDRSNEDLYDPSFSTEQMIVLHEFASIPKKDELMSFKPEDVLKPNQMFWGYGAGSSKYYTSISDLPHMMIIGASGSGKSNFINGLILSLLNNISKIQKMYLVDLKSGIEFNRYKDLNQEKINVFSKGTSPSKFLAALQEVEAQMYLREEYMVENNIIKLNDDPIFIIIDEYAQIQLMHARGEEMMAKDEIVDTLIRIGTRARSANIKLIVQTQDPRAVEDELKVHLMSRALLKTSKENDMAFTLQNEDLAIEMGIKHTMFDKGRYVFEDYNDGDTQMNELQFPYIDPHKALHDSFDMSNANASGIDLNKYTEHVANEYPYLANTQILKNSNTSAEVVPILRSESAPSEGAPFDFNSLLSADSNEENLNDNFMDDEDEDNLKEINRLQSESLDVLKELLEE